MPYIQINRKSLYYTISEPRESKPVVLLIHGLGSSSSYYYPVIHHLKDTICCIAIDTPGSGLSELGKPEQSIYSIVEDAVGLLDALGITQKVTVVGHSMGGIVASQLAVSHSKRVNGVMLIGPVNPSDAITKAFEKRIQAVKESGIEPLATTVPTAATGTASTPLHHAFIRHLILSTPPAGYISLCSVIAAAKRPAYAAITVPLVIIAGSDDTTAPLAGCNAILENYGTGIEDKRIEILPGVGHWHCVEAGELVAQHIGRFVLGGSAVVVGGR